MAARQEPAALGRLAEAELIYRTRLDHLVEVCEPLVLISQVHRSGGTLLNHLLQGHPECHVHAHELQIGHPHRRDWPDLALDAPGEWFRALSEKHLGHHLQEGYRKWHRGDDQRSFPFCFVPTLQRAIFECRVASRRIERQRDVLDCYFTSYFNAWLDNQNLYSGPKRLVAAHAPRLLVNPANLDRFFADYPDGTLASVVREPAGWYHSVQKRYPDRIAAPDEETLGPWRASTEAALGAAERWGDRVVLLTYEQLALETEHTMKLLAGRLGISMSTVLLTPTFNGLPTQANSSDVVAGSGVLPERAAAYRESLGEDDLTRIEALCGSLYEQASAAALS